MIPPPKAGQIKQLFLKSLPKADDFTQDYLFSILDDLEVYTYDGVLGGLDQFLLDGGLSSDQIKNVVTSIIKILGGSLSSDSTLVKSDEPVLLGKIVNISNNSIVETKPKESSSSPPKEQPKKKKAKKKKNKTPAEAPKEEKKDNIEIQPNEVISDNQQDPEEVKFVPKPSMWEDDVQTEDEVYASCLTRGRFPEGLSKDVKLDGIHIAVGGTDLLENASLRLQYGHHYGLLGKNGTGKSTLLRHIARHNIAGFPPHLTTLHVRQEIIGSEQTVHEAVLSSDIERERLLQEEAALSSSVVNNKTSERLREIFERLEDIEANSAPLRASQILEKLNFDQKMQTLPTKLLSGGWRMRVALASALFLTPDILLLDEPTNHLDFEAVLWLQTYLQQYNGTIIVVSHDRTFLNEVATDIIHLHKKQLHTYPGNFDAFQKAREDKKKMLIRLQTNLDSKIEHFESSIKKMEQAAINNPKDSKRMSQVTQRKKKLNRVGLEKTLDGKKWICQEHGYRIGSQNANGGGWKDGHRTRASIVEQPEKAMKWKLPALDALLEGTIIRLSNVSLKYVSPPKTILKSATASLNLASRIAIVGKNGVGKSSLVNLLCGHTLPTTGEIWQNPRLKIGYYAQHYVDQLDLDLSPLAYMTSKYPQAKELDLRKQLGSFGLGGQVALTPIRILSGGQKSRVVFAEITFSEAQMLLLDEPTNHLDLESITALEEALEKYRGAVIIISHDQSLISSVAKEIWYLPGTGSLEIHSGSWNDHRETLLPLLTE